MNPRANTLSELAKLIQTISLPHPVRVGIDGVDCSGKTTLGNELASVLRNMGCNVIRISIDGFHNCREIRYKQGHSSPKGFYEDTFNHEAIISCVLAPLGPGGDLYYNNSQFDFKANSLREGKWQKAFPNSIVLFDGIFLHRPELVKYWDFTVFVHVGFDETVRRARERDQYLFGSSDDVEARYQKRYIPGQKIYLNSEKPNKKADVVFDNSDIPNPVLKINSI